MSIESDFIPYHAVRTLGTGPVLILAPHPDDEAFGCGGSIMRHVAAGDPVTVIIVTDGGGGCERPEQIDYITQRRAESRSAAMLLGYGEPEFWDYRDRQLACDEPLIQRLLAAVRRVGARWLYAPSLYEIHPDHQALGLAAWETARRAGAEINLAFYEIGAPLSPNRLLDITDLVERKRQAIACFAGQLAVQDYDRHIMALNTYRAYTLPRDIMAAEAYWVLNGAELQEAGDERLARIQELTRIANRLTAVDRNRVSRISIAIVTYAPDLPVLAQTLARLRQALAHARQRGLLAEARLTLVDNGPGADWRDQLQAALDAADLPAAVNLLSGQGNIGYGAGHNLALVRHGLDCHLILNPDVLMEEDALSAGLAFLAGHPEAGLLAPAVWGPDGQRQYLCRAYPTVLDLALRGFAPDWLKRRFRARLERYELRDQIGDAVCWDPPLISGCFMLGRRDALLRIGGFDPAYFLYFEDYDLSLRLARHTRLAYTPAMRIVHLGGQAARKGLRHTGLFLRAAVRFFNQHGWRWR